MILALFLNKITLPYSVRIQRKQYPGKIKEKFSSWEVSIPNDVVHFFKEARDKNLPKETGGIIVGFVDTVCKEICIVDASAMPSDSTQGYCFFERGKYFSNQLLVSLAQPIFLLLRYGAVRVRFHAYQARLAIET